MFTAEYHDTQCDQRRVIYAREIVAHKYVKPSQLLTWCNRWLYAMWKCFVACEMCHMPCENVFWHVQIPYAMWKCFMYVLCNMSYAMCKCFTPCAICHLPCAGALCHVQYVICHMQVLYAMCNNPYALSVECITSNSNIYSTHLFQPLFISSRCNKK